MTDRKRRHSNCPTCTCLPKSQFAPDDVRVWCSPCGDWRGTIKIECGHCPMCWSDRKADNTCSNPHCITHAPKGVDKYGQESSADT